MKLKPFLLLFLSLLGGSLLFAQNPVRVNPVTGAANVVIPLAHYQRGSIDFPINLVYSGSGTKPLDVERTAGINFDVQAGGQVTRVVRGLPDDCVHDSKSYHRYGWLYNTKQGTIAGFTPANTGSFNCTSETNDISFINSNLLDTVDTEPDYFYVDAPGLHCQMIYDQSSHKFQPVEYQDLKITYTTASTDSTITGFTIVNDQGTSYLFNVPEYMFQYALGTSPVYMAAAYKQYKNGLNYCDRWMLATITDINGNSIQISYNNGPVRGGRDSVKMYVGGSTTASLQYIMYNSVTPKNIQSINIAPENDGVVVDTLHFTWTDPVGSGTGRSCVSSITGINRNIQFGYDNIAYTKPGGVVYLRAFLQKVYESGCGSPLSYQFNYYATTPGTPYDTTLLPDSTTSAVDYWGYYSAYTTAGTLLPSVFAHNTSSGYPSYLICGTSTNSGYSYTLSGSNRATDSATTVYGTLNQITDLARGGATYTITYQANRYYDPTYGGDVMGGGVRAYQVTEYDGISTAHNIVHTYTYVNPHTGHSSGKPVTLPQYAFSMPYTGSATGNTLWIDATVLSAFDLSSEDHTIMYEYERESLPGIGSTLSQFYLPACAFDLTATPDCSGCSTTEWTQTSGLVSRSSCVSYGVIASNIQNYPFIPSANYDFERGLPKRVTHYASTGSLAASEGFAYVRTATPSTVAAFRYDDCYNGSLYYRGYNKYSNYFNTGELVAAKADTVYDAAGYSQANNSSVSYTYGSTYHKLLTSQTTNSDGSSTTQYYTYLKDIGANNGSNLNIKAIYQLQQLNADWPVETYTKVTNSLGTSYTKAALTLFSVFTSGSNTLYRPSQQLSWIQPNGNTFTQFSVNTGAQTISYDPSYFPSANFIDYDYAGVLQTSDDGNKHEGSRFYDHVSNKPVAVFTNADAYEVVFDDFDSNIYQSRSGQSQTGVTNTTDRNGKNAGLLASTGSIVLTFTKNANAANYIFSAWFSGSGNVTVKFSAGSASVSNTKNVSTSGGWQYVEWPKFGMSTLSGTVSVTITTSAAISIDDILAYPENTEATTYAYDLVQFFKICETNTNGVSAYYKYDPWGRLLYAYDQDRNIFKKNTYVLPADVAQFGSGKLTTTHQTTNHNTAVSFVVSGGAGPCVNQSLSYTFKFGDASGDSVLNTSGLASHQYTVPGTYYATLTTRSPYFGTIISTDTITVTAGPNTNLSYTNSVPSNGSISSIAFYNGSTLVASFTAAQLTAGTAQIVKGTYTIKITMASGSQLYPYPPPSGSGGYTAVDLTCDGSSLTCGAYSSTNLITIGPLAVSCNNLNFNVVNNDPCD